MALLISLATSADRDVCCSLLAAQLEEHSIDLAQSELEAAIDAVLARPELGFFLLAREGTRAVGAAYVSFIWSLEHGGFSSWLDELYVVPERRGRGVGTELLRAVIEHAHNRGCRAVDLEVDQSHARSESLYAREGFRRHRRMRFVQPLSGD